MGGCEGEMSTSTLIHYVNGIYAHSDHFGCPTLTLELSTPNEPYVPHHITLFFKGPSLEQCQRAADALNDIFAEAPVHAEATQNRLGLA